jgi:hypothetical protein
VLRYATITTSGLNLGDTWLCCPILARTALSALHGGAITAEERGYAKKYRSLSRGIAFGCAVAGYSAGVGYLLSQSVSAAVALALAGLAAGVFARDLSGVAIVATVGVWVTKRAPGVNVSFTDLLIAFTGAAALVAGVGTAISTSARLVFRSFAFYLASLTITLAYNQSFRSDFEWFHRISLVGGAIFTGAWLVLTGRHRSALRALLAVTTTICGLAILDGASSGFSSPAQPLGYQKNFVGSIAATVLVALVIAYRHFGLSRWMLRIAGVVILAGLLASHSRGAMLAAITGISIWSFRTASSSSPRLRLVAVAAVVAVGGFAYTSIRTELAANNKFSSINQRVTVERATRQLWEKHPLTGVGLRYFKTPKYADAGYQAPNNVLNEVLAEAGVFGLLGFLVFVGGSLVGLARLTSDLGAAGLSLVAGRFVHGLFDIYWTGGTTALVWVIAGMGLATATAATERSRTRGPWQNQT